MRFIESLRENLRERREAGRARRYLEKSGIEELFNGIIRSGNGKKIIEIRDRRDVRHLGFLNNTGEKRVFVIRETTPGPAVPKGTFDAIGVLMTHEGTLKLKGGAMVTELAREEWANNREAIVSALGQAYEKPARYGPRPRMTMKENYDLIQSPYR